MYNQGHTKSQNDFVHQHVWHRVSTLIFNRKGLCPFTEVVSDDKYVSITIRCGITDVKNIHSDPIPSMTSGNITQWMMTAGGRFPLHASCALFQPFPTSKTGNSTGPVYDSGPNDRQTTKRDRPETMIPWPVVAEAAATVTPCELIFLHITPFASTDKLLRWCHNNRISGHSPLTSFQGGKHQPVSTPAV